MEVPHRYLVQDGPGLLAQPCMPCRCTEAWVGRRVVVNSLRVIIVASVAVGGGVSRGLVRIVQDCAGQRREPCSWCRNMWASCEVVPERGGEVIATQTADVPNRCADARPRTHSISSLSGARSSRLSQRRFLILVRPMSPDVPSRPPWTRECRACTGSKPNNGTWSRRRSCSRCAQG